MPRNLLKFGLLIFTFVAIMGGVAFLSADKAVAQVTITINDIEDEDNYVGELGDYTVDMELGAAPLPIGGTINIDFPDEFTFTSDTDVEPINPEWLNCGSVPGENRATCTVPNSQSAIQPGEAIEILVFGVTNPEESGTYQITVSTTSGGSATRSVFVDKEAEEGGGGSTSNSACSFSGGLKARLAKLPGCIASKFIEYVVGALSGIIGMMVAMLILIGATMIEIAANLSNTLADSDSTARIGFDVSLGIANIGFVFAIILIAFATILRRSEGYTIKKALPRLIIIAILINFSWYFAIAIIELSNSIANGLMDVVGKTAGSDGLSIGKLKGLGGTFTNAFEKGGSSGNLLPKDGAGFLGGTYQFFSGILVSLMKVVAQAIFGLIAFFALISTAVMLIIRHIALSLLLTLLPLALVMNIFPNLQVSGTEHPWKWWQGEFTKWILFYPVVMFFLALGFIAGDKLLENPPNDIFEVMVRMLVVSGIMIGGLLIARKMGITGANFANAVASKTIRRIPANIAALTRTPGAIGRKLFGRTGTDGEPEEEPRNRLQFAETPRGVPTPESLGERPEAPVTFADADRPYMQEEMDRLGGEEVPPAPEPTPTSTTPPERPEPQQSETQPEAPKKGWLKKGLGKMLEYNGKFLEYSAGGPSSMQILGAGIKEIVGEEAGIFKGLYPAKTSELKDAEKKLQELKDKKDKLDEKDVEKELLDVIDKLAKDDQAPPDKKSPERVRKALEAKRARLDNPVRLREKKAQLEKDREKVSKGIEKTQKEVKKFGGKIET